MPKPAAYGSAEYARRRSRVITFARWAGIRDLPRVNATANEYARGEIDQRHAQRNILDQAGTALVVADHLPTCEHCHDTADVVNHVRDTLTWPGLPAVGGYPYELTDDDALDDAYRTIILAPRA